MAEAPPLVEPRVCLIDASGELASTQTLLNDLGIGWCDGLPEGDGQADLLITTPQAALSDTSLRTRVGAATHVVMGRTLSRMLRKELERHPCDFVVELPIDPSSLRALIEHALYRGPERRKGMRAMIGGEVKLKAGFFTRRATLLQLSERGCGLHVDEGIKADEVTLRLPTSWTGGRKLDLRARVLSQHARAGDGTVVALEFCDASMAARKRLREIMKGQAAHGSLLHPGARRVGGPTEHARSPKPAETPSNDAAPAAEEPKSANQRRAARKTFHKRMLATLRGQAQAVVSRDISAGGMRLAADPEIGEGDELKLALYGGKGSPPLVLRGVVVHADATTGLGLEFIDVPEQMQDRLDAIVEGSPISGPVDAASGRSKVVVTEIVDRTPSD